MKNIDVSKLSIEQLKALAFDEIRNRDAATQNLNTLNKLIVDREQQLPKVEPPKTKSEKQLK